VKQEMAILNIQFQWLLNTETDFLPEGEKFFLSGNTVNISENPLLNMMGQQKNIASQQTALEKAKLLPGWQLAYNLNSFKGAGPDDKIYGAGLQFHSVQLGVSLPLFSGGQKARIEAAKVAETIAEN